MTLFWVSQSSVVVHSGLWWRSYGIVGYHSRIKTRQCKVCYLICGAFVKKAVLLFRVSTQDLFASCVSFFKSAPQNIKSYPTSTTFLFWNYKNNYLPTTNWRFNFMTWYSLRFANKKNSANLLSYQELHSHHDCTESCKLFHNTWQNKSFPVHYCSLGVLPIMANTGRLRLKGVSFSDFRYVKG